MAINLNGQNIDNGCFKYKDYEILLAHSNTKNDNFPDDWKEHKPLKQHDAQTSLIGSKTSVSATT